MPSPARASCLFAVMLLLVVPRAASALEADSVRLGLEYLYPADDERKIYTFNLDAWLPVEEIDSVGITFLAGITATYAKGDITQLEGELSAGTLREVTYEGEAVGIGPGVMADLRLPGSELVSLHIEAGGSFILYNTGFPPGGEIYNFMWRAGPVLRYDTSGRGGGGFGLGFKWMHVSNGQGMGPQNPSYDARGVSMFYSFGF